jgi:RNA polymerase sigma-70 factor (ECF subfamily)
MHSPDQGLATLIRQARDGDTAALGRLLDQYRAYFQILAARGIGPRLGRRVNASDVVQQTMLEACRDFVQFLGSGEPELVAWLERILQRNIAQLVRDHITTQKRAVGREQAADGGDHSGAERFDPAAQHSSPSQRAMRGEEAIRLARALVTLPEDQREAVRLRHLEGWSLAEISAHFERSPAATAGLIKRGMQKLREKLGVDSPL